MLTGTASENESVEVIPAPTYPTKDCNVYHWTRLNITQDPNDNSKLLAFIRFVRGYEEAGEFVQEGPPVEVIFDAATLAPYMTALVTNGQTRKRAFKDMLWAGLTGEDNPATSAPWVPAGTVS